LEALTRIAAAKVLFGMWGETALYWSEPLSWLSAWVFVFVPYLFYQRRNLR
jgi:hypothetical protein